MQLTKLKKYQEILSNNCQSCFCWKLIFSFIFSGSSFRVSGGKLQPKVGPGGRMMVKSFSHGAGSSMATTVAAMVRPFPGML